MGYPVKCTITEVQVREIADELGIPAIDLESAIFRHLGLGYVTHGTTIMNAHVTGCAASLYGLLAVTLVR